MNRGYQLGDVGRQQLAQPTKTSNAQPVLTALVDALTKTLASAHAEICRIERAADRLVGATPPQTEGIKEAAVPQSLEAQLHGVLTLAEGLNRRIVETSNRFDAAV
jgi:hypothetical protein